MAWHSDGGIAFDVLNNGWGSQRQDHWPMLKGEIVRTDIVTTDNKTPKVCNCNVVYTWYGG